MHLNVNIHVNETGVNPWVFIACFMACHREALQAAEGRR